MAPQGPFFWGKRIRDHIECSTVTKKFSLKRPTCPSTPTKRVIMHTGHRGTASHSSEVNQTPNSCCCSSSALGGHGSWTQSGCTLQTQRRAGWGVPPVSAFHTQGTRKQPARALTCGTPAPCTLDLPGPRPNTLHTWRQVSAFEKAMAH